jgi:hypothetical protein
VEPASQPVALRPGALNGLTRFDMSWGQEIKELAAQVADLTSPFALALPADKPNDYAFQSQTTYVYTPDREYVCIYM